jgi:hypothetical protein
MFHVVSILLTRMCLSAGKGSGLSFQDLPDFTILTTSVPFIGEAETGNHYGPARSFLGDVDTHDNGMADLLVGADGNPLVFDPRDIFEGGNMVLWDDAKGGAFPWDENYFNAAQGLPTDPEFDPEVSTYPNMWFHLVSLLLHFYLHFYSSSCSTQSILPTQLQPIQLE